VGTILDSYFFIITVPSTDIMIVNQYHNGRVGAMVFNATFNNISVISWPSVLLLV
jgi:hypothetical protein